MAIELITDNMVAALVITAVAGISSFAASILLAFPLSAFLYSRKMWKSRAGKTAMDGTHATVFNELHKTKEVGTPRMGGILVWLTPLVVLGIISYISQVSDVSSLQSIMFVDNGGVLLFLLLLTVTGVFGLADDVLEVKNGTGGLSLRWRLLFLAIIGGLFSWFLYAAGVVGVSVGLSFLPLGIIFIPVAIMLFIGTYAGGVIDGVDGLAGGLFAIAYAALTIIALLQANFLMAIVLATVAGSILGFLWFNVPPARFYMSETGSMSLTMGLVAAALLLDQVSGGHAFIALPLIGFLLYLTVFTSVLQMFSKRFYKKKIFLSTPIHHHFEAIGWSRAKITMRYWIIAVVFSLLAVVLVAAITAV